MSSSFSRLNSPGSPSSTGRTRSGRSVAATCSSSLAPTSSRSRPRARFSLDRTVPTGTSSAAAIWSYAMPSHAKSSKRVALPLRQRGDGGRDVGPESAMASRRASTSETGGRRRGRSSCSPTEQSRRGGGPRPAGGGPRRLLAIPYSQGRASGRSVSYALPLLERDAEELAEQAGRRRRGRLGARSSGTSSWRGGRTARRTTSGT